MSEALYMFGVDLGTTNTVLAYFRPLRGSPDVRTVRNPDNKELTPSVVHFYEDSREFSVGDSALAEFVYQPERTFRWVKRYMGIPDIKWEIKVEEGEVLPLTPQTVSARILRHVRQYGSKWLKLNELLDSAVITVPAYFREPERVATIDSADIAGIKHYRLVEEPTAAILDYIFGLMQRRTLRREFPKSQGYIAVFDLGGGTFDISVAELNLVNPNRPSVRILANNGNRELGGYKFDLDLANYVVHKAVNQYPQISRLRHLHDSLNEFISDGRVSDSEYQQLVADLLTIAEETKIKLSSVPTPDQSVRFRIPRRIGRSVDIPISRREFEELLQPYLKDIERRVTEALTAARASSNGRLKNWRYLDQVILVGGATRIPAIQELAERLFGRPPAVDADSDLAVARGAAIQAAIDAGFPVMDVARCTSHAYGILGHNGEMEKVVILQGAEYPRTYSTEHTVSFSLDISVPIVIGEQFYGSDGNLKTREIKTVQYHHPFLYTGDVLDVVLEIDSSGLLKVRVTDPRTLEEMEATVKDISMSEEEKQRESEAVDSFYVEESRENNDNGPTELEDDD